MLCTWIPACFGRVEYHVERETRPGLTVDDDVCEKHMADAERHGYRVSKVGEPAAADHAPEDRRPR
jgi:hypothetical protein